MTQQTKKLLSNYEKACIELADEFLAKYFGCVTEYTDPSSYACFIGRIGGTLDCGSDIAFFGMDDIAEILEINPPKDVPYSYICDMVDNQDKKWQRFTYWYSQQKK